jgi:hypothetical protein
MGGSKRFCVRNVGNPEQRISFSDVLPIRSSTAVDKTPICGKAMADESCVLFVRSSLLFLDIISVFLLVFLDTVSVILLLRYEANAFFTDS